VKRGKLIQDKTTKIFKGARKLKDQRQITLFFHEKIFPLLSEENKRHLSIGG